MLYANVYQHTDRQGRVTDFCGMAHPSRDVVEAGASYELKAEPRTRRLGVLRIRAKEGVRE